MIHYLTAALMIAALALGNPASTLAQDEPDLLTRVDEIRAPGANFQFVVEVLADGNTQKMEVSVKDRTKSLVRYTMPAKSRGRAILFVGNNMWVYVPGTRRALRISPQQRILGGVSTADVARIVYSEDYRITKTTVEGANRVLQLAPKTKGAAYGRIDLIIDATDAPLSAVYFAGNGTRKLKTVTFAGYSPVLGEMRPTRFEFVDHADGGAITHVTYSQFKTTTTPQAWYQPSYLPRL